MRQPPCEGGQREHVQPRRRQLERQGQSIQLGYQLRHQGRLLLRQREVCTARAGALHKEHDRRDGQQLSQGGQRTVEVGNRERRDAQRLLPADMERRPAGHQQRKAWAPR